MKKRVLSLLLSALMMVSLLSGCYIKQEDTILTDGTVTAQTIVGLSEEYYLAIYDLGKSMGNTMTYEEYIAQVAEVDNLVPYEYDGTTYWVNIQNETVALEEYLSFRFGTDEDGKSLHSLTMDEQGNYVLSLTFLQEDLAKLEDESIDMPNGEVDETEMDSTAEMDILTDMNDDFESKTFLFQTIRLPKTIGRASGNMSCYTLDDNAVTLDLAKIAELLSNDPNLTLSFQFSTAAPTFVDTPVTAWYTAAAEAMAAGGLMAGVGDSRFSPDTDLTVGELAQILARATGLPVGTGESGYWAEIAIKSCLEKGYITDRGEVNQANYGVPVDRQESAAAMQRASGRKPTGTLTAADIPDFAAIKDEFKQDLLDAYNSGVTAGMDENRTCGPDLSLTRAQVAQLFYALGWTAPLA